MVRAIVLYDEEPEAERYERHAELCRKVPDATFRHGRTRTTGKTHRNSATRH